jgi:predicted metal-binding protein
MSKEQTLEQLIDECGFELHADLDPTTLRVLPEVRGMCAVDKCATYDKSWSCPPACGTLDEFRELFPRYSSGYVLQTVGEMEDEFDFESMVKTGELHGRRFYELVDKVKSQRDDVFFLSAGTCRLCETCSYPDAPCRHPERMYPSMEATGLLVSDVCTSAGIPYYHGKNTLAFVGCVLVK